MRACVYVHACIHIHIRTNARRYIGRTPLPRRQEIYGSTGRRAVPHGGERKQSNEPTRDALLGARRALNGSSKRGRGIPSSVRTRVRAQTYLHRARGVNRGATSGESLADWQVGKSTHSDRITTSSNEQARLQRRMSQGDEALIPVSARQTLHSCKPLPHDPAAETAIQPLI